MDVKPHHWITAVGNVSRRRPPKYCQPAAYYDQQAIDALRAELEDSEGAARVWRRRCQEAEARAERAEAEAARLRKLCLEAVGRLSVTPDGGDLHDRLIAASMKGEG